MDSKFQADIFCGFLLKGELNTAVEYLGQFPEKETEKMKYRQLFENAQYITYPVDDFLQQILNVYQKYYREVFYLCVPEEQAAQIMAERLTNLWGTSQHSLSAERAEENVSVAFSTAGYHILCGKTGGFYGPYIWKETETLTYAVELPGGIQQYTVKLLSGFISRSWLDYISLGKIGTGGWTDSSGIINCIRESYDLQSEHFRVSLLKHEAQHARDLIQYPGMSSEDLEYRAKLVELIYSSDISLLGQFLQEADRSRSANGHGLAAARIADAFPGANYTISEIQSIARSLFCESSAQIAIKYVTN